MDQEADAGNYGEHGQRQAVQHQVEADVEITDRHPGPQRHADRLFAVSEKVDANVRGDQRRQPTEPMPTVAERFSDQRPRERRPAAQSQSMAKEWLRQACSSTQLTY